MIIDKNTNSAASNYPEFPNNNSNVFGAQSSPGTSDTPKTEQEWIDFINDAYGMLVARMKHLLEELGIDPLSHDFTELRALFDKAITEIHEKFKNNEAISPKFLLDLINSVKKEAQPFLDRAPETSRFKTHFLDGIKYYTNEIEKQEQELINKKKAYMEEMERLLRTLISLLVNLPSDSPLRKSIENAISELSNNLKDKPIDEFFNKDNIKNVTDSIDMGKKLIKEATKGSTDFPMDPDKDGFDTSIPRNPDGSIDVQALVRKMHDLLYYMYHGDCSNFNIYTALAGFLTNVAGIWDQLSGEDKASFNNIMNQSPSVGGKSLGQILAESVIYGKFFNLEKDDKALFEFIDKLISKLDGKDNPFIKDFLESIKKVRDGFAGWKETHMNMSFKDFLRQQSLVNAAFGRSNEMYNLFDSIMHSKMQELEAIAKGDPFLLFYLILMLLFENDSNYQTQISGVGKVLEKLDKLGSQAGDLGTIFQEISQRAKTDSTTKDFQETFGLIKKFMDGAQAFCEEFKNDPRLSSSFAELKDSFNHLFSKNPGEGLTTGYKDQDGNNQSPYLKNGRDATLGEYFDDVKDTFDPATQEKFARTFQTLCCPGKVDPSKTNPSTGQPYPPPIGRHYTQLTADIQAFSKAPLNMNSTLTIKMEDIKATSEQYGALLTKFAKEPTGLVERMLQRIQK
jgi:hypothetical protein